MSKDDGSGCFGMWLIYVILGVPLLGLIFSGKAAWYIYVAIAIAIIVFIIKLNKKA